MKLFGIEIPPRRDPNVTVLRRVEETSFGKMAEPVAIHESPPCQSYSPPSPKRRGRPKKEAREPNLFDLAWDAYPVMGRRRSSRAEARPYWSRAVKSVGGEQVLLDCVRRYSESPDAKAEDGKFVPGFHRWLKRAESFL